MFQWLSNLIGKRSFNDPRLADILNCSVPTTAGVSVNENTALNLSAVFAAVNVIASTISTLPLLLYQRTQDGKERAKNHYLYPLLHDAPNSETDKTVFWQTGISHLCLWGNMFAEIERANNGKVTALHIVPPHRISVDRASDGSIVYLVSDENGGRIQFPADSIFHVVGLSYDGLIGYSPIRLARNSLGLTKATENYGAKFFANSCRPSGAIKLAQGMNPEAKEDYRRQWADAFAGSDNAGRPLVLTHNADWVNLSMPNDEAQFLDTRRFQIEEISRWYSVPLPFLGDLGRATWSNLPELNRMLLQYCLQPILSKIEQQISSKLLLSGERQFYFAEFLLDSLLRADAAARMTIGVQGVQNGIFSVNEVRERDWNLNSVPGGDIYKNADSGIQSDTANPADKPQQDNGDS